MTKAVRFHIGTVRGSRGNARIECDDAMCGEVVEPSEPKMLRAGEKVLVAVVPGFGPRIIPLDRLVWLESDEAQALAEGLAYADEFGLEGPGANVRFRRLDELQRLLQDGPAVLVKGS